MKFLLSLLTSLLLCLSGSIHAASTDLPPDQLVQSVTEEVLEIVRKDKDIREGNKNKVNELVDAKVLPHFDFQKMTRLALGKEARKASPEQMTALVTEFRTMLVNTYSTSLTQYRDQKIVFKDFKAEPTATEVTVKSEIKQSGGKPVQLDYQLEKMPNGWKVVEIVVSGISLVANYRNTFSQEIQANGIDGLIRSLQTKNKHQESGAKPK